MIKQLKKIRDGLAEIKIRLDRGNSLMYWARNIIIMVAGVKFILGQLSLLNTILTGIGLVIGIFLLGWLDLNVIHLYQAEAKIATTKYNPVFKVWDKKIK